MHRSLASNRDFVTGSLPRESCTVDGHTVDRGSRALVTGGPVGGLR